jgi:plastocyanin
MANQLTRGAARGDRAVMRAALLAVILLFALAGSSTAQDLPQLVGTVGPGFTIDLTDARGKHVDELLTGRYQLLVHDLSDIHNFVLGSKRTQERLASTEVEFVGDMTFTIDLTTPGLYVYACSPHFQTMSGRVQVVTKRSPPVAPTRIAARVSATAVVLSPKPLIPGSYRLTVTDRSRTRNFHIIGPGVNRRTAKAFVGTVTWMLQLKAGTYRYGNDPRLTGRVVVG